MPELWISDRPAVGGRRHVEVTWRDGGAAPRTAVAEVDGWQDGRDTELVRWYLEDYAEYPADPLLARRAEESLVAIGQGLFRRVFSSRDAAGIWDRVRDRLSEVRVEVDADPAEGGGLGWELLRDPDRDGAVALGAGTFVRTNRQAASHSELPEPSGGRLRVLLVISRPAGAGDVPFRSVASRLVLHGGRQIEGLDLDVLRPATFVQLSRVLHEAKATGRPYHVVHFDGHGVYVDVSGSAGSAGASLSPHMYQVSVAGPVRVGRHGYLMFEEPSGKGAMQFVDGPTLGRLLVDAGVPVVLLNACRSAYSEARDRPVELEDLDGGSASQFLDDAGASLPAVDVHGRIRAYGSLASEIADMGVPGVVAMRYNVYVVTAAQFVADLYRGLLLGRSLGEAAITARRELAAHPDRQIGDKKVSLQDWAVPLVYESAPLVLLAPEARDMPRVQIRDTEITLLPRSDARLPRPPDVGFLGRDETLLALDRTFDSQPVVLLHAFAGAGKTSTAAEFARWYQATGGLDHPEHLERELGTVLWTSFENHLTAERAIVMAGDRFTQLLKANGITWATVTDPAVRRDLIIQVLKQVPVLWVWDNVEPVTGFPTGTLSTWTKSEQDELADLVRDLAHHTRCKVLLTSRRDERGWLGDLPVRVRMPDMPMRERLHLAAALAARRGLTLGDADWRPLLRFTGGNPLTITIVTGQALHDGLTTSEQIAAFVRQLQDGTKQLEAADDTNLGRTRSLTASLDYGFSHAFTDTERAQLAILHLFRDTTDAVMLRYMGDPGQLLDNAVPELGGLDHDTTIALLDRAGDVGLLTSLGNGWYQIHPALPWYFTALFTRIYGEADGPVARRAARAYARAVGEFGDAYIRVEGLEEDVRYVGILGLEEANFLHALEIARACKLWEAAVGCMQGLNSLYGRTGRNGEWTALVSDFAPDIVDSVTGEPHPGGEEYWGIVVGYQARQAESVGDWSTAVRLRESIIAWDRQRASHALAVPPSELGLRQRILIRNLAVSLTILGDIRWKQQDPGCLGYYQESLPLSQRIGDPNSEANTAISIGNAYLRLPSLRDLDQAEHWYQHSMDLRMEKDTHGRAQSLGSLAAVAHERFLQGRQAGDPESVLMKHLDAALRGHCDALSLAAPFDHYLRATSEQHLGAIYAEAGDIGQAVPHFQRALWHHCAVGNIWEAGHDHSNLATALSAGGLNDEALRHARAARENYLKIGLGAASDMAETDELIVALEAILKTTNNT